MSKRKQNFIIVAHPDDETIFFGGLILSRRQLPWHVVCVTDGNADNKGPERMTQFKSACHRLGVKTVTGLNLPDQYDKRLDIQLLKQKLMNLGKPNEIYTHNPIGEYGHPHHQDVSLAVHEFFLPRHKVWGTSYNCMAEKKILLTQKNFEKKSSILTDIYFAETERFIQFLPAASFEGFNQFSIDEVRAVYAYMTGLRTYTPIGLKKFRWLAPYFSSYKKLKDRRPF